MLQKSVVQRPTATEDLGLTYTFSFFAIGTVEYDVSIAKRLVVRKSETVRLKALAVSGLRSSTNVLEARQGLPPHSLSSTSVLVPVERVSTKRARASQGAV